MAERNPGIPYSRPYPHENRHEQRWYPEKESQQEEKTNEFDLFDTAQTVMETYRQLAPYVKQLSKIVKKKK